MYCTNCGEQINDKAAVCVKCGVAVNVGDDYCSNCGGQTGKGAAVCTNCGVALRPAVPTGTEQKSRQVVGILGIFFGTLGVHNFILGYTGKAIVQLLVTVIGSIFTFGLAALGIWIWALIESIQILSGKINVDAKGVPLRD